MNLQEIQDEMGARYGQLDLVVTSKDNVFSLSEREGRYLPGTRVNSLAVARLDGMWEMPTLDGPAFIGGDHDPEHLLWRALYEMGNAIAQRRGTNGEIVHRGLGEPDRKKGFLPADAGWERTHHDGAGSGDRPDARGGQRW